MRLIRKGLFYIGVSTLILMAFIDRSRASVTLTSSLSVSEQYTDNFFFSAVNPEAEFTTTVMPSLGAIFDNNDMVIAAQYQGGVEYYLRHPNESRFIQGFSLGLDFPILSRQVKELRVKVTETVTYTPQPKPFSFDNSSIGNEGIQVPRVDTFQNRSAISVGYSWTPRFSTTIFYGNLVTRYRGGSLQDYDVNNGGLEGRYQLSPRTSGWVGYSVSATDYLSAEDVLSHGADLGIRYQISPTFSWSGQLGFATIPGETTALTLETGFSKSSKWWEASLRYNQDIGTGGGVVASATLSKRVTGQVTWKVGKETSTYVQLAYGENTTLGERAAKITSYETGTGIRTAFLSWLSGSLTYSYLNQKGEGIGGVEGRRSLVTFLVTAIAPPWRMMK
jgi:predicted porin